MLGPGGSQALNKPSPRNQEQLHLEELHFLCPAEPYGCMMSAAWVVGKEYHQSGSRCLGMATKVAGRRMLANAKKRWPCKIRKKCCGKGRPDHTWRGAPVCGNSGRDSPGHCHLGMITYNSSPRKKLFNQLGHSLRPHFSVHAGAVCTYKPHGQTRSPARGCLG